MAESLSKVLFHLEPDAWHGSATETLWAERVDDRRFRLRNVPFYAFGVSVEDVVFAKPHETIFEFESVSMRGGHSTYRIMISTAAPPRAVRQRWLQLEARGCSCSYEQGHGRLMAVDVAPEADIDSVHALLEDGQRDGLWDFEEGHCGHVVRR